MHTELNRQIASVIKEYRRKAPDGRRCQRMVAHSSFDGTTFDFCDRRATLCLDVHTTTIRGRHVVNKVGWCDAHVTSKYVRWFQLEDIHAA